MYGCGSSPWARGEMSGVSPEFKSERQHPPVAAAQRCPVAHGVITILLVIGRADRSDRRLVREIPIGLAVIAIISEARLVAVAVDHRELLERRN